MVNQTNQVDKTDIERPDNNTKPSYQHNRRVKNLAHQQHNNKKMEYTKSKKKCITTDDNAPTPC